MANKTFEEFEDGGEAAQGDILVGLRSSDLTRNYKMDFPGSGIRDNSGNFLFGYIPNSNAVNWPIVRNSSTGNAVQFTATGEDSDIDIAISPRGNGKVLIDGFTFPAADGTPNSAVVTNGVGVLSFTPYALQDISTTATPTFNNLQLNGGIIFDSDGQDILEMRNSGGDSQNWLRITNSSGSLPILVEPAGAAPNIELNLYAKAFSSVVIGTQNSTHAVNFLTGDGYQHFTGMTFPNTNNNVTVIWQDVSGTVAYTSDITDDVHSVVGTANQISVNNTDPQNPVLSLPHDIIVPGSSAIPSSVTLSEAPSTGTNKVSLKAPASITSDYDVVFPAAASANASSVMTFNTAGTGVFQDFLQAATFTPTITFSTPGDLSVVYTTQQGTYFKFGNFVAMRIRVAFTPTYFTAAGSFFVVSPLTAGTNASFLGMMTNGVGLSYPAGRTQITPTMLSTTNTIFLRASGSSIGPGDLSITNVPSGTAQDLAITIFFMV